jgi:hypothetical protein
MPTTPPESGVAPTRIAKASAIGCRARQRVDIASDSIGHRRAIARQRLISAANRASSAPKS